MLLKIAIPSAAVLLITGGVLTWALWPKNKDVKKINPDVNDPNKPGNIDDISNIDDTNDDSKNIKSVPPINVNEIKKLHFDNITTADQMLDALKQIAQNYKFFGLKSSDVGFNGAKFSDVKFENGVVFEENDDITEFYRKQVENFETNEEINQKLNKLKENIRNIENDCRLIISEDKFSALKKQLENLKFDLKNDKDASELLKKDLNRYNFIEGHRLRWNDLDDYLRSHKLSELLDIVETKSINKNNELVKMMIKFEENEDNIKKILAGIEECDNKLKNGGMNENFVNTIEMSKKFRGLFSQQVNIQNFRVVFNKGKNKHKQNTCFEFNFYDSDNKKLWCRYNMNFRDKKVEIGVGNQMKDIDIQ